MQSLANFFGVADSSVLTWAHRVNTSAKLGAAMQDQTLHVLEADVTFGPADAMPLIENGENSAELDVVTFITTASLGEKAIKLDFHQPAAVEPTLAILRLLKPATPVVLHADIFALLSGKGGEGLEPEQFIRMCQQACPQAVISLGWSLKRAHDADGRMEDALIQQLSAMVMQRLGPVSYGLEIRAGYTPAAYGKSAERGAALILDPLPPPPLAEEFQATNVVSLASRMRKVA